MAAIPCPPQAGGVVWMLGVATPEPGPGWRLVGLYAENGDAEQDAATEAHFVAPLPLGMVLPPAFQALTTWPGLYYPNVRSWQNPLRLRRPIRRGRSAIPLASRPLAPSLRSEREGVGRVAA